MRIAVLPQGLVTVNQGLSVEGGKRPLAVPIGVADSYFPVGPLAVDPSGSRAWVRAADGRATRVDLRTGKHQAFDFELRGAVYDPRGSVVAVLGGPSESLALVEFDDDAPERHRPLPLPEPRRIHWPYGAPYRFAAYDLDWDGALRLSATRWGVALAHVNGTLWARFSDGHQGAWTMPPVYQGWSCAFPHEHGLVVTCVHNGRTGEFVWLDREGVWHDAFDSSWKPVSPCVPTPRGFVAAFDDELVRFEGYPATITERVYVGGRPEEAAIDLELRQVVVHFGDRRARMDAGGDRVVVRRKGEESQERLERVAEPGATAPWTFEAIDDPDLGRIWKPELTRVARLVAALHEEQAVDPAAAARSLQQALQGVAVEATEDPVQLEDAVWRGLRRWVAPYPSRAALTRMVERLATMGDDPFLERALRAELPGEWGQGPRPTRPADAWIRARVPALHEGRLGERTVTSAVITADVDRNPPWSVVAELEGGGQARVAIACFDPATLVALPSEANDEVELYDGVLTRHGTGDDGEPESVIVEVDPWPGGFAHRVTVTSRQGGAARLRTGAQWEPVRLSDPDQARALAYGAESWPTLYLGRVDGALAIGPFADELEGATLVPRPAPLPAIAELLDGLVADEQLELARPADDELRWAVEVAIHTASSAEAAAAALETLLLDHEAVDELYADPDELRDRVAPLLRSAQP